LKKIGITPEQFLEAISSFEGAAGRLQKIKEYAATSVYKDFAHAPSKAKATVKALKEIAPSRDLVAVFELHTFSSLNKKFIPQYKDSMKAAQQQIDTSTRQNESQGNGGPHGRRHPQGVAAPGLLVFQDSTTLENFLLQQSWKNKNLLFMSSGQFGGLDIPALADKLQVS